MPTDLAIFLDMQLRNMRSPKQYAWESIRTPRYLTELASQIL
jgi:hypothetical protein